MVAPGMYKIKKICCDLLFYVKRRLILGVCLLFAGQQVVMASNLQQLSAMFKQMVVAKSIQQMPRYYTPDFILYSNGQRMSYAEFYKMHAKIYKTPIQYHCHIDKSTVVSQGNKIAVRMQIEYRVPPSAWHRIEVILIAHYKSGKIQRLWEVTSPAWGKKRAFNPLSG